jgi:hypothetical protein
MQSFLLTLFFMTLAAPALAVDGVREINQTCAVQMGCFVGDTAGFPVTIDGSAGKSYRHSEFSGAVFVLANKDATHPAGILTAD